MRALSRNRSSDEYNDLIADAVQQALQASVIVVAAAGNNGGSLAYPAALPGVIAVTALAGPKIAYQPFYASRGNGLWVTAYGGDSTQDQDRDGVMDGILSTDLSNAGSGNSSSGYGLRMGTSMAAPQVAGLAALALSSGTPASLLRSSLAGTTTDIGPLGFDARFGFGLISGRSATGLAAHVVVIALEALDASNPLSVAQRVKAWTVAQADSSFELSNLPVGVPLELVAASDLNANGVVGEAGELLSSPVAFGAVMGARSKLVDALVLQPSGGAGAITLR